MVVEIQCVTVVLLGYGAATFSFMGSHMIHSGAAESLVVKVGVQVQSMVQYQTHWKNFTPAQS